MTAYIYESSKSIMWSNDPVLITGSNFGSAWVKQYRITHTQADLASLQRHIVGAPISVLTEYSKLASKWDANHLVVEQSSAILPGHVYGISASDGTSYCNMRLASAPEVYCVSPYRLIPGEAFLIFGPNLRSVTSSSQATGLVDPVLNRPICYLVGAGPTYIACGEEIEHLDHTVYRGGTMVRYRLAFRVPVGTAPGTYDLYVHCGSGGDYGWAKYQYQVEVVAANLAFDATIDHSAAVGDYETDCTATIQGEISALSTGGGTLQLGPGVFLISDTVVLEPNVRLRGMGPHATVLKPTAAFTVPPSTQTVMVSLSDDCVVSDLGLDARGVSNVALGCIGCPSATDGAVVERVRLENMVNETDQWMLDYTLSTTFVPEYGAGLVVNGGTACRFEDIEVRAFQPITGSTLLKVGFLFRNCRFESSTGRNSVHFMNSERSLWESCSFFGGRRGVVVQVCSLRSVYLKCDFEGINEGFNAGEVMLHEMNVGGTGATVDYHSDVTIGGTGAITVATPIGNPVTSRTGLRGLPLFVYDGAGVGQVKLVESNTVDTITVEGGWDEPLDSTSKVSLAPSSVKNLFMGGTVRHCDTYYGPYGSHLWDFIIGMRFEDVGGGVAFWGRGPAPSWYNTMYGVKVLGGGVGAQIIGRLPEDLSPPEACFLSSHANEVRCCEILGEGHAWPRWDGGFRVDPFAVPPLRDPFTSGISFGFSVWDHNDQRADGTMMANYTLISNNRVAGRYVGAFVGVGAHNTVLHKLVTNNCREHFIDRGVNTYVYPTQYRSAPQSYEMVARDSVTGAVYRWRAETDPDFSGVSYPGPNAPLDVAVESVG